MALKPSESVHSSNRLSYCQTCGRVLLACRSLGRLAYQHAHKNPCRRHHRHAHRTRSSLSIPLSLDLFDDSFWYAAYESISYGTEYYYYNGQLHSDRTYTYGPWQLGKYNPDGSAQLVFDGFGRGGIDIHPVTGSCWTMDADKTLIKIENGAIQLALPELGATDNVIVDPGKLYQGFYSLDHANSNKRISNVGDSAELESDQYKGERTQWTFTQLDDGYAYITSGKSGEKLMADVNGSDLKMGTAKGTKARWEIISLNSGEFMLRNKEFGTYLCGAGGDKLVLRNPDELGPNYRWIRSNFN